MEDELIKFLLYKYNKEHDKEYTKEELEHYRGLSKIIDDVFKEGDKQ